MNIFTALSPRGDNKLRETNLSAILAYFLDPAQDHGLSVSFLQAFLKLAGITPPSGVNLHKTYVETEQPQDDKRGKMNLDIVVELRDNEDSTSRVIVVENKIKASSADAKQLARYYNAVHANAATHEKITMVFLTPAVQTKEMQKEYENLDVPKLSADKDGNNKVWLHWSGDESSVRDMLRVILREESEGDISPINEYAKHTLKALIVHLNTLSQSVSSDKRRTAADYGEAYSIPVIVDGRRYKIVRAKNSYVHVRGADGKTVDNTTEILRQIIEQENLKISLVRDNKGKSAGKKKNPHPLGREVIKALREKGMA